MLNSVSLSTYLHTSLRKGGGQVCNTLGRHPPLPDTPSPPVLLPVQNRIQIIRPVVMQHIVNACVPLTTAALGRVNGRDRSTVQHEELVRGDADDVAVLGEELVLLDVELAVARKVWAVELAEFCGQGAGKAAERVEEEAVQGDASEEGGEVRGR